MRFVGTDYTLVLYGTVKYRYPMIAPITQAIIAPLEMLMCIATILVINYSSVFYGYWAIVESLTFVAAQKTGRISRKHTRRYALLSILISVILIELMLRCGQVLLFTHINTVAGMLFWLRYVRNENYPMVPVSLAIFVTKLAADLVNVVVYFPGGSWLVRLLNVFMPVVDAMFILVYFKRKQTTKFPESQ